MTNTETLDLDAIEGRALAATPGAWAYDQIPETGECRVIWDGDGAAERDSVYAITSGGSLACNAEFIAHAREDVPALIAEVRRLREREERAWKSDDFEIVNGWLVERGVLLLDYPAGAAYGAMPYSDAEPVLDLKTIAGWPEPTEEETR